MLKQLSYLSLGLVLCATTVHALQVPFARDCGIPGWVLVGGGGTFSTIHFHAEDIIDHQNGELNRYDYELVQRSEGGNAFVGYGLGFCGCYRMALRFDAHWTNGAAKRSYSNADLEDNVIHEVRCKHFLDLTLQPGIMAGNCVLLYLKGGVSWADIKQQGSIMNDDPPYNTEALQRRTRYPTGYVIGVGTAAAVNSWISLFAEFDWRRYELKNFQITAGTPADTTFTVTYRIPDALATSFSIGLLVSI